MHPPLFEVRDLRIAVFDADRAFHGDPGPTSDAGEELADGWVEVLCSVSFSVAEGEVLALIGESASGKSLALMGGFGLLAPGARVIGGSAIYSGHEYKPGGRTDKHASKRSRKERKQARQSGTVGSDYLDEEWSELIGTDVGFIFQNPIASWTPDHVIGEQAGEALDYHTDLSVTEIEDRVFDALGEVKLPKSRRLFSAYRHQLSRGMAQRAMLAAALTKAPRLMIADEPLTGLDPPVAAAIMDLLRDMQRKRRMAMVIVSHDLAAVAGLADSVAVMYSGEIVEQAPSADLYHHPKHPYSAGLIGSIPGFTEGRLRHIEGEAPRLQDTLRGRCVFVERCEFATKICWSTPPEARQVDASVVACHHATELELPGIKG